MEIALARSRLQQGSWVSELHALGFGWGVRERKLAREQTGRPECEC